MSDFMYGSSNNDSDGMGTKEDISLKESLAGFSPSVSNLTHPVSPAVGNNFGSSGGTNGGDILIEKRLDQLSQEIKSIKLTLTKIEQDIAMLLKK